MRPLSSVSTLAAAAVALMDGVATADAAWLPGGTPVAQDDADESLPVLASDAGGSVTVAWQQFGRIHAQRLTRTGDIAPGWPADHGLEVCPDGPVGPCMQSSVRIAPDAIGGVFVLWHDERRSDCQYFCIDQLRADGAVVCDARSSRRSFPRAVPDGTGGAYAAWYDSTFYPRATHLTRWGERWPGWPHDGAHLSDSPYGDYQMVLAAGGGRSAYVAWSEGRQPTGTFSRVLTQELLPGWLAGDTTRSFAIAWPAARPDPRRLHLASCSPNPTQAGVVVTFSLPDESPAWLEVFDLQGRRRLRQEVSALGRGQHVVEVAASRTLPTGVYLVRLSQAGKASAARVAIIH